MRSAAARSIQVPRAAMYQYERRDPVSAASHSANGEYRRLPVHFRTRTLCRRPLHIARSGGRDQSGISPNARLRLDGAFRSTLFRTAASSRSAFCPICAPRSFRVQSGECLDSRNRGRKFAESLDVLDRMAHAGIGIATSLCLTDGRSQPGRPSAVGHQ